MGERFLSELGEYVTPAIITGNFGAKKLGENPGFHKRAKHISQWKCNKADLLAKALPAALLRIHRYGNAGRIRLACHSGVRLLVVVIFLSLVKTR